MDAPQHLAEGDFGGWAGESVSPGLAPLTFHDAARFQFDQDLDQVIGRDPMFVGNRLHTGRAVRPEPTGERQDGPDGIVAFDRKFHEAANLPRDGPRAKSELMPVVPMT